VISHGQATRSTWTWERVIHFIFTSPFLEKQTIEGYE